MKFLQLRTMLIEQGCTRKQATLAIRLSRGLETYDSLYRKPKWNRADGESVMSQKVDLGEYLTIYEVSKVVTAIEQDIL